MPNLGSFESVYLLLTFVVPVFVTLFIRSKFLTGNLLRSGDAIMAAFILSCVQAGVAFPVLLSNQGATPSISGTPLFWVAYLFAAPALLGALLGVDARFNWSRSLLSKLRILAVHPIPNSWDWHFREQRPPSSL
ncbi:MAG: DUF6338 family protein [Terricaulis sp.]